jgi:hypothetical protein
LTVSVPGVFVLRLAAWHSGLIDAAAIGDPDAAAGDPEAAAGDPDAAGEPDAATGEPDAAAGDSDEAALDGDAGAWELEPDGAPADGDAAPGEPEAAAGELAAPDAGAPEPPAGSLAATVEPDGAIVGTLPVVGVGVADPPTMLQPATKDMAATRATAVSNRLRIRPPPRGTTQGSAHCDAPGEFRRRRSRAQRISER